MVPESEITSRNIFIESIFKAAETTPRKAAFSEFGGASHSWREFTETVSRIALTIRSADPEGVASDRPLALLTDRGVLSAEAIFGAMAAGRWYTAVDSCLPPERIAAMVKICSPSAVVCASEQLSSSGFSQLRGIIGAACPETVFIDLAADSTAGCGTVTGEYIHRSDTAPMFGIFTSGSTGVPKLVVKSRRAMGSFITEYCRTFGFTSDEVFGNQIPFYFDASTKDLFATALLGASCVIIPQSVFSFPVNLVKVLNDCRVTTIVWVPSALSSAARFNVFSVSRPEYLKNVLFVGEKMPVKYLNVWRNALPGTRFVNLYGSTEVAGNSCYFTVSRDFGDGDILPVGMPFDGTQIVLIDPETGLPSDEGEICVSGPGLADGYYGEPEKTAAAFRELDIPSCGIRGRFYFSGDFGRYNGRGELECVSRRDSQIKHMGHRIELGDIESAALSSPAVSEAVCVYNQDEEKIYLFFSPAAGADPSAAPKELRRELLSKLPRYMIPHNITVMAELPRNRNGKADRAALKLAAKSGR